MQMVKMKVKVRAEEVTLKRLNHRHCDEADVEVHKLKQRLKRSYVREGDCMRFIAVS